MRTWYEIINPSDMMVIAASDPKVVIVAVALLSEGMYGLRDPEGKTILPILGFGWSADETIAWFREHVLDEPEPIEAFVDQHTAELADALESICYGSATEARAFDAAIADMPDRDERRRRYNEVRRSSMNNVALRASHYAKHLREKVAARG